MIESIVIILFFSYIFGFLAKKIKFPHILGYILAGVLIGPYMLNGINDIIMMNAGFIKQISLMLILIIAGLSINIEDLKVNKFQIIALGIFPSTIAIVSGVIFGIFLLRISILESIILGIVVCGVAPAIILPRMLKIIEEKRDFKQIPQIIFSSITLNDIILLFLFPIILFLINSNFNMGYKYLGLIPIFIAIELIIAFFLAKFIVLISKKFIKIDKLLGIIFIILSVLVVILENRVGGRIPFSAILFLVVLSILIRYNSRDFSKEIIIPIKKIWYIGEILLFTLLGASLNFEIFNRISIVHFILLFIVQLFMSLGVLSVLHFCKYTISERKLFLIAFSPKATMQAAIGGIPLVLGLAGGEDILIISVIAILIFAPLGSILLDKYLNNLNKVL